MVIWVVVDYDMIVGLNDCFIDLRKTLGCGQRILSALELVYLRVVCVVLVLVGGRILLSPMDELLSYHCVFPYLVLLSALLDMQSLEYWSVDVALIHWHGALI
jgi:hypothetical protein